MRRRYSRQIENSEWRGSPAKTLFARELRANATSAERALWEVLRARRLLGFKFRRQHLVAGFVVDFYCPELRLAIEVDGESHLDKLEYDSFRTEALSGLGIQVMRFTNAQVLEALDQTEHRLKERISALRAPFPPSAGGRAGEGGI